MLPFTGRNGDTSSCGSSQDGESNHLALVCRLTARLSTLLASATAAATRSAPSSRLFCGNYHRANRTADGDGGLYFARHDSARTHEHVATCCCSVRFCRSHGLAHLHGFSFLESSDRHEAWDASSVLIYSQVWPERAHVGLFDFCFRSGARTLRSL